MSPSALIYCAQFLAGAAPVSTLVYFAKFNRGGITKFKLACSVANIGFLVFQGLTLYNSVSSLSSRLILSAKISVLGGGASCVVNPHKALEKIALVQMIASTALGILSLATGRYAFAASSLGSVGFLVYDIFK